METKQICSRKAVEISDLQGFSRKYYPKISTNTTYAINQLVKFFFVMTYNLFSSALLTYLFISSRYFFVPVTCYIWIFYAIQCIILNA